MFCTFALRLLARRLPGQSSDFYILTQVVSSCQSINFFQFGRLFTSSDCVTLSSRPFIVPKYDYVPQSQTSLSYSQLINLLRLSFALFLAPFLRRFASLPQLVHRVNQLLFTSFASTVTLLLPRLQQLNYLTTSNSLRSTGTFLLLYHSRLFFF